MLGAIFALARIFIKSDANGIIKIMGLYVLGTAMLLMVLETAGRYKGGYYSALTASAVCGFCSAADFLNRFQKRRKHQAAFRLKM